MNYVHCCIDIVFMAYMLEKKNGGAEQLQNVHIRVMIKMFSIINEWQISQHFCFT